LPIRSPAKSKQLRPFLRNLSAQGVGGWGGGFWGVLRHAVTGVKYYSSSSPVVVDFSIVKTVLLSFPPYPHFYAPFDWRVGPLSQKFSVVTGFFPSCKSNFDPFNIGLLQKSSSAPHRPPPRCFRGLILQLRFIDIPIAGDGIISSYPEPRYSFPLSESPLWLVFTPFFSALAPAPTGF